MVVVVVFVGVGIIHGVAPWEEAVSLDILIYLQQVNYTVLNCVCYFITDYR